MKEAGIFGESMVYRKHYIPLESNPKLFTQLIHQLGISTSLAFQDVLSLSDPDLLAFIPRPAFALILVFPTTDAYEQQKAIEEVSRNEYQGCGEGEQVMWFRQTINNACGLYSILHEISNGASRDFIRKFYYNSRSIMSTFIFAFSSVPDQVSWNCIGQNKHPVIPIIKQPLP